MYAEIIKLNMYYHDIGLINKCMKQISDSFIKVFMIYLEK